MESDHFITTPDGTRLHYRLWRAGTGRPLLVLLHGLSSNLTRWSEFVEHTTLKERFDILRLDLRGHGGSSARVRLGIRQWCTDLEHVLDHEAREQAVIIGHSLGANVALHFAARAPQRVAALVAIDPLFREAAQGIGLWVRRSAPLVCGLMLLVRALNAIGLRRRRIPPRDLRQLDAAVREQLLHAGKETEFVKRYTSPLADMRHFPTASYLAEMLETVRALPPAGRPTPPTLVLISRAVTFTDMTRTRTALARDYPRADVALLSAYHWPLTEKPLEIRKLIEDWCNKLPR